MSEAWARRMLAAYRLAGAAAFPLVGGYIGWRATRGKEDRLRRRERYGVAGLPRPKGPLVWVHAASVGETVSVIPLIERILGVGIGIILTTGTVTSAGVAQERLGDRIIHQYVPLDMKPAVCRFLDHWQPDLALIAESEIWPATILELGARRIPQVLVNGRLSDRSFKSWQKRPHVAEALFETLAHVVAQSEDDAERFRTLGARPVTVSGNLKVDVDPLPVDRQKLRQRVGELAGRATWAAVSTHAGEETVSAEVHQLLRRKHDGVLTIIVPRHPDRADAVSAELEGRGLKLVRSSRGEPIRPETDILLGDTMGEMGLYLRLTEIAFVGCSMTAQGGHNPIEPAMLETAILSGEKVQNFSEPYRRLIEGGGARLVKDREMLAGAVSFLLKNDPARRKMIDAATATVDEMRGALDRTLRILDPFIHPLIVKARLDGAHLGRG